MLGKQHAQFGVVTGIAAGMVMTDLQVISLPVAVGFVGASLAGSLLPDADHEYSTVNFLFPPAKLFYYIFGKRKLIHDPVFYGIIAAVMAYFAVNTVWFGILFGIAGHLLLDAFTEEGIPFFYLVNRKHRIHLLPKCLRFRTDSDEAVSVTKLLSVLTVVLTVAYFCMG